MTAPGAGLAQSQRAEDLGPQHFLEALLRHRRDAPVVHHAREVPHRERSVVVVVREERERGLDERGRVRGVRHVAAPHLDPRARRFRELRELARERGRRRRARGQHEPRRRAPREREPPRLYIFDNL